MPQYFFDVMTDVIRLDREGSDLPDAASAQAFAEGLMTVLWGSEAEAAAGRILIRCENGRLLGPTPGRKTG